MKPIIFLLLLIPFYCSGQGSNGLVAHWNFNGSATDVSGNNLNGTVTNASLCPGFTGTANTAYQFNGTNSGIDVANSGLLNLDSFSICVLLKPMGFYSGPCQGNIVVARGPQSGPHSYYLVFTDNCYDNSCSTYTLSHETYGAAVHSSSSPSAPAWYGNNDTIVLNSWNCVTLTYVQDSARIYLNGTLRHTLYYPDSYTAGYDPLSIGYFAAGVSGGYPYWFNGVIDDIRLYNRALSPAEAMQYCDTAEMTVVIDTTAKIDSVSIMSLCAGSTFNVYYSVNHNFQSGNTFTVQLSDATGSFSSPVVIGTASTNLPGFISCTIPTGTPAGTGYRIRIVASAPAYTTPDVGIVIGTGFLAAPKAGNNSPICAGDSLVLNSSSATPGVSFSWTGPNGFTASIPNPVILNAQTTAAGTYTVTISASGCSNSATTTAFIYPNEVPVITLNGIPCLGAVMTVSVNNTSYDPSYYQWNFGTANVVNGSGAGPYSVSWATTGPETISLYYTGHCKQGDTQSITIQPLPVDHIAASKTNICSGDSITLRPYTDSVAYTYKWSSVIAGFSDTNAAITTASLLQSGYVYMHIYDENRCMGTDSLLITAEPCCTMYVPNAFF